MKEIRCKATALLSGVAMVAALSTSAMAQNTAADTYKAKCASCHGADGEGNTPIGQKLGVKSIASGEVAKHSDQAYFDATQKGKGKMPPYGGKISDGEIKALVQYIRTLEKAK